MANQNGLLPYGENDGSVVYRSPLTSLASINTPLIGSSTVFSSGSNQLYDAVKGFRGNADGSHVILDTISGVDKLNYGGQITFKVPRAFIACPTTIAWESSGGDPQSGGEVILSHYSNPRPNGNYQTNYNVVDKLVGVTICDGTAQYGLSSYYSDANNTEQFVTYHIVQNCNTITVFLDGVKMGTLSRGVNFLGAIAELRLGTFIFGGTLPLDSGFVKDLQISSKIWSLPVHPLLANVATLGDSYAATNDNAWIATSYNNDPILVLTAELRKHGFDIGKFTGGSFGGRSVIGSGTPAIHLKDNIATVLAAKPTFIIHQAGANDIGQGGTLDVAAFTAAMRDAINQCFGLNGYPFTYTQRMLVCSTPWPPEYLTPSTANLRLADTLLIRGIQAALPAWFNTTYPALAGRLGYRDTYQDFGGDKPNKNLYGDGVGGNFIHPTVGRGWYTKGMSWYRGILPLLQV